MQSRIYESMNAKETNADFNSTLGRRIIVPAAIATSFRVPPTRRWRPARGISSARKSIITRRTNLELERFLVIGAGGVVHQCPRPTQNRSDGRRTDGVPVLAGYRAVIASCAYQCLRAGAASARQALHAAGAAREGLRGRAILPKPRDLALHVVPQIPRPTRDTRSGVALQQGAGFRLEILIEFWRTSTTAVVVAATVPGIRAPIGRRKERRTRRRRVN